MLVETFPRLAIRLRSTFPDAQIRLLNKASALSVSFPAFPAWEVEVSGSNADEKGQFQILQSSITLRYECLQDVPAEDFHKFIAAENLGLRGTTILVDEEHGKRTLKIRSTFIGQKGRTRDEAENVAMDVLSLLRFARLLEDRIVRSVGTDETFNYDLYYSTYLSKSIGRNRFINYARSIFQGSTERVFGQVASMLKEDYKYKVNFSRNYVATITSPDTNLEIIMRIPEEIPMLTCSAAIYIAAWEPTKSFDLVARLNSKMKMGHFEVNADGSLISFVTWKHLTNDLRYYSLDQMVSAVREAQRLLMAEIEMNPPVWKSTSGEQLKQQASSLDAYRSAA